MGKEINLSKKTVTEDKNGNVLVTGKVTVSVQPTDNNDLTTKSYVDDAIAQASIGGGDCDLTELQAKEDEGLNTEDKTIVGAINELETDIFNAVSKIIEFDVYKADKEYVEQLINENTGPSMSDEDVSEIIMDVFGIDMNKN